MDLVRCEPSISTKPKPSSRGSSTPPRRASLSIIAKAGKPLVKVVPIDSPAAPKRLGFMRGAFTVPDDFDTMGQEEIEAMFGVNE